MGVAAAGNVMKVMREEFQRELGARPGERTLNIIFAGMSGSGKTHWAKLFSQAFDYPHVEIDSLIGQSSSLAGLLCDFDGEDEAEKMGRYFGMPWTDGFAEREKAFLEIEAGILAADYPAGSLIDLPGSAIYHSGVMARLADTGPVIYLETDPEAQEEMLALFLRDPKPVCWKGGFRQADGESPDEALRRCYPELLRTRAALYERYADVTLPYACHKNLANADGFAAAVLERL